MARLAGGQVLGARTRGRGAAAVQQHRAAAGPGCGAGREAAQAARQAVQGDLGYGQLSSNEHEGSEKRVRSQKLVVTREYPAGVGPHSAWVLTRIGATPNVPDDGSCAICTALLCSDNPMSESVKEEYVRNSRDYDASGWLLAMFAEVDYIRAITNPP